MDKKFREEFKRALKMINFVKQKQKPIKAEVRYFSEPAWGKSEREYENE